MNAKVAETFVGRPNPMTLDEIFELAEALKANEESNPLYDEIDGLGVAEVFILLADALEVEKLNTQVAVSNIQLNERALLRRYMQHVKNCEGITFCDRLGENDDCMKPFSEEEKKFLVHFAKQLRDPLLT